MKRNFRNAFFILFPAILGYVTWASVRPQKEAGRHTLTVFCAAGLKQPVETIARQYQRETGIEILLQYGPTGALLSQLQIAKQGDVFIATDDGSLADARKLGVITEVVPIAAQHPVVGVKKGNAKNIRSLSDLSRADVKLAIANPESASISKVTRKLLAAQWDGIAVKAAVMKPTVTEIAADVQLGAADAAILWDSTVPQFKELEVVELPELTQHRENASAAVLAACTQPEEALKFARYLGAVDQGGKIFRQHGFQLVTPIATAR